MPPPATIRAERASDIGAIRRVNEAAFGTDAEARLVDLLRDRGKLLVSLVAERGGRVVGHIAFSRVRLAAGDEPFGVGLGPMAVAPAYQRLGIGVRLVRFGILQCRLLGARFVVVLGHPHYYPRFGFQPASQFGLSCAWPVPEGVFMAMEIQPGALANVRGRVSYEPEFDDV